MMNLDFAFLPSMRVNVWGVESVNQFLLIRIPLQETKQLKRMHALPKTKNCIFLLHPVEHLLKLQCAI